MLRILSGPEGSSNKRMLARVAGLPDGSLWGLVFGASTGMGEQMQIIDFSSEHISDAMRIARANYEAQRRAVPYLPPIGDFPNLAYYTKSNLGVAALAGDRLVGYLLCVGPFLNAFSSTDAVGVYAPLHANGTVPERRAEIYARMYQAAAAKWARAGAASHAVCLYASDTVGQAQFFRYGFGMRCADAIRGMDEIDAPTCDGIVFTELLGNRRRDVLPLERKLDAHMAESPTFMLRPEQTEEEFWRSADDARYFGATKDGKLAAYLRVERSGETFVCDHPSYIHINGAYCLPEYRGRGIMENLINCAIRELRTEGYTMLGVDYESINPAAQGFWEKHFAPYTAGLVRRIDEHVLRKEP